MVDAERALLGALINDPDQMNVVAYHLDAESLYSTTHQTMFKAMQSLRAGKRPFDPVLIKNEMQKLGQDISVTDVTKLSHVMPTGQMAEHYAEIVKENYIRRRVDTAIKKALPDTLNPGVNITDLIGSLQKELTEAIPTNRKKVASVMPEIAQVWDEYLDYEDGGAPSWVTTGLYDLDQQVCLAQGTHTIIGAAPSQGKTSLGVTVLRNVAKKGKRVLFFTLEQTRRRMLQKIISQEAGVSHKRLITGRLSDEEKTLVTRKAGLWGNPNICMLDGRWSVADMRVRAINEQKDHGLDMIIVDLLGLIQSPADLPKDAKEHRIFNQNSRYLQELGVELNVPIITMAHLNREIHKRPGGRPILSDLREAGEQFADNVIFIHREYLRDPRPEVENIAELLIAKNRDGQIGKVEVGFDGPTTVFYNIAKRPYREDPLRVMAGGIQD